MWLEIEQANSDRKRQSEFQTEQLFRYIFSTNESSTGMWDFVLRIWGGEVEQMNNRLIYRQARFR